MSKVLFVDQFAPSPLFSSPLSPKLSAMTHALESESTVPLTDESSDLAVMSAAAQDDSRAFTLLVQRYQKPIRRMMVVMVKDAEIASDLTQDTFTKVWAKRKSFDTGQTLRPWLFAIARNVARSHLRWARVRRFTHNEVDILPSNAPHPLREREENERKAQMHRALAKLSVADREIIALRFAESMSFREVAEALGIREATARVKAHRALERLKKEIKR